MGRECGQLWEAQRLHLGLFYLAVTSFLSESVAVWRSVQKGQLSGLCRASVSLRFWVTGAAVVGVFDKFGICLSSRMELVGVAFLL